MGLIGKVLFQATPLLQISDPSCPARVNRRVVRILKHGIWILLSTRLHKVYLFEKFLRPGKNSVLTVLEAGTNNNKNCNGMNNKNACIGKTTSAKENYYVNKFDHVLQQDTEFQIFLERKKITMVQLPVKDSIICTCFNEKNTDARHKTLQLKTYCARICFCTVICVKNGYCHLHNSLHA